MSKKLSKILCLVLAIAMIGIVFAGCNNGDADVSSSPSDSAATDEPSDEPSEEPSASEEEVEYSQLTMSDDKTTVTHWTGYTGADRPIFETIVESFNTGDSGYQLDVGLMSWTLLDTKLTAGFATGTAPDFFVYGPQILAKYFDMGGLKDITYAWDDGTLDRTIYPDAVVSCGTLPDGTVVAAPMCVFFSQVYYNIDELAAAGWDSFPTTLDELWDCAVDCTIVDDGGNVTQYGLTVNYDIMFSTYLWNQSADFDVVSDDLTTCTLDAPGLAEYVQSVADLIINDKISPTTLDDQNMFAAGTAAMMVGGPWFTSAFTDAGVNFEVTAIPAGANGQHSVGLVNMYIPSAFIGDDELLGYFAWENHWSTVENQQIWASGTAYPSCRNDMVGDPEIEGSWSQRWNDSVNSFESVNYITTKNATLITDEVIKNTWQSIALGQETAADALASAKVAIDGYLAE